MAQVIMLQVRYTVKEEGRMCHGGKKNKHPICFLSLDSNILYSYVCPEILPFTQSDSQFLSLSSLLWANRWEPQSPKRGSLITVKPGYIIRDMNGSGGGEG